MTYAKYKAKANLILRFIDDMTRDLLRGCLDKSAEYPRRGTADCLPRLACVLRSMEWGRHARSPPRIRGRPVPPRPTRATQVHQDVQGAAVGRRHRNAAEVRGCVGDKHPADPAALLAELERERDMRRHEASDEAVERRAAELGGSSW